jgi:hypothetical protein
MVIHPLLDFMEGLAEPGVAQHISPVDSIIAAEPVEVEPTGLLDGV